MSYFLEREVFNALDFDLDVAINHYASAKQAHRSTVGVPAPVAHPIVATIVDNFGGDYELEPEPEPPPPPPPPNLYEVAAAARYQAEIGGILLNGIPILTDRESQGLIGGAVSLVSLDPQATIRFKLAGGSFISLSAQQVLGIGLAVGRHVQACFGREADVAAEILTGMLTTPAAVQARFADLTLG